MDGLALGVFDLISGHSKLFQLPLKLVVVLLLDSSGLLQSLELSLKVVNLLVGLRADWQSIQNRASFGARKCGRLLLKPLGFLLSVRIIGPYLHNDK